MLTSNENNRPIPPCKTNKCPHPGTQILSQILRGAEGNKGQMPHIGPGSPSGLTLIDALRLTGILIITIVLHYNIIINWKYS